MEIVKSNTYEFQELAKYLSQDGKENEYLKLYDAGNNCFAIMHVLGTGLCEKWQIGDGILFYDDGETHSANDYDTFKVVAILKV